MCGRVLLGNEFGTVLSTLRNAGQKSAELALHYLSRLVNKGNHSCGGRITGCIELLARLPGHSGLEFVKPIPLRYCRNSRPMLIERHGLLIPVDDWRIPIGFYIDH